MLFYLSEFTDVMEIVNIYYCKLKNLLFSKEITVSNHDQ